MNQEFTRLLVIGLDGGTFDLLEPLTQNGVMPHLAQLIANGSRGTLLSTLPPFTGAAWGSFITGQNPGQHGIIDFQLHDRFNYDAPGGGFVSADHLDYTLWEMLSDNDRQVMVINVPLTYPPRPVNGYMVTGMLTPVGASQFTFPAEFTAELGSDYMVDVDFVRDGQDGFRRFGFPPKQQMFSAIQKCTRARTRTCIRLLKEKPWDFCMVVFTGTDRLGHFFWDELVAAVNRTNDRLTPLQQQLLDYFRELDTGIGQLLEAASANTNVLVMSDHGFGPAPTRRFYVNVWLERLGLMRTRGSQGLFDLEYWRTLIGRQQLVKKLLRRLVSESTQHAVKQKTESVSQESIIDWLRTSAYYTSVYFQVCGISVNLEGERREGWIKADDVYETIRDRIISAANELHDPESGQQIVQRALRREEVFTGPHVHNFPDIILVLDPDYLGAGSLAGSSVVELHHKEARTGEHREEGIFIAFGPDMVPGQTLSTLTLPDVTATILYALKVPVVDLIEGEVVTEIFRPEFLAEHPLRRQSVPVSRTGKRQLTRLSSSDEAALKARLQGLGYVE